MSGGNTWGKRYTKQRRWQCKGPEVVVFQVCLKNNKEASIITDLMLLMNVLQKGFLGLCFCSACLCIKDAFVLTLQELKKITMQLVEVC